MARPFGIDLDRLGSSHAPPATRTYWLSFSDENRPTGAQFLGAAVIDVTERDVEQSFGYVTERRAQFGLPAPPVDTVWIAAAIRKAHEANCNPGGEVASIRIDDRPEFTVQGPKYPRQRLLSRADIEALDDHDA